MEKIDITKKYEAECIDTGHVQPVEILTTKGRGSCPIVAYVGDSTRPSYFDLSGRSSLGKWQMRPVSLVGYNVYHMTNPAELAAFRVWKTTSGRPGYPAPNFVKFVPLEKWEDMLK